MKKSLTKNEVIDILKTTNEVYKNLRPKMPSFVVESKYSKYFYEWIQWIPVSDNDNIVPIVKELVETQYNEKSRQIFKILDQNKVDGSFIYELVAGEKLLLRKDQKRYNRQIPGRMPKGILRELWHDYNHWLLAVVFWDGFISSLQPSFKVNIPLEARDDINILLAPELKPLWGMWNSYKELGSPLCTSHNDGNAIFVNPWEPLSDYRRKIANALKK